MARTIRIEADTSDYRGLIYAMNRMDRAAQNELRQGVAAISRWSAEGIRGNYTASPYPQQASVIARSVKPLRDRMPFVQIGGRSPSTYNGTPAGVLMMGAEFGAYRGFPNGGRRFPYPSGRKGRGFLGYFIYPALRMMQPEITRRWKRLVLIHIEKEWARG